MAKVIRTYNTDRFDKTQIGNVIDVMKQTAKDGRLAFERRWYDNNFFDDGYHFRYVSRTQQKIVDLSANQSLYAPMRALPKASRQIRGVANLLLSQDPTPVVYPEQVNRTAYPPIQTIDPNTGQPVMQPNPQLLEAQKESKRVAKLVGHWLEEEFKYQEMMEKLAHMALLTLKHGVSYMQIWPDAVSEEIKTQVYDAFDIYLMGNLTSIYDSPFICKSVPMRVAEIKANENFDPEMTEQITPDNKYANSEIKEAYLNNRYGRPTLSDELATVKFNEIYIKEYLTDANMSRIREQEDGDKILRGKDKGDIVIRQSFSAGNICVKDGYVSLPDYPFVDLRLEPGPIYGVPMIERFIPANKSLDLVASRVERFLHVMVTGSWMQQDSEGELDITNSMNGQVIKYKAVPPVQNQIASIPAFVPNFMSFLTSIMEEQGVTTTTLGKLPSGVKSGTAIESLKESEYANLVISSRRLKGAIKRICEKMLDLADDYFIKPQTVYYMEKGEPQYFDVIGKSAIEGRARLGVETDPEAVPLNKEYRVDIEVQSGIGFTREGKRQAMQQLIQELRSYATEGYIPPEAIKVAIESYLEVYGFGATSEFMEAMEEFQANGNMADGQIDAIKVGMMEVMQDLQKGGVLPTAEQRIQEGKVATAESIADITQSKNENTTE